MGYFLPLINLAINIHIIFGIFTLQLLHMFLERFKVRTSLDTSKKYIEEKISRHLWTQKNLLQQQIPESYFKT